MAKADGSIIIETDLDAKEAQDKLNRLKTKIENLNEKISDNKAAKMPLVEQARELGAQLDAASAKLDALKNSGGNSEAIKQQAETVKVYQSEWNRVNAEIDRYDRAIKRDEITLDRTVNKAGELSAALAQAGYNSEQMAGGTKKAEKSANAFASRLKSVVRSALVFTVITQALSKLRSWLGDVVKASPEASAAIAKLKGALLTMVQPLVNVVIPAFTTLVNVLTAVVSKIAQVFAMLTGSTLDSSKQAAKALNEETKALNGTGSAAKKAGKSLAGFDEINKLTSNSDSSGGSSAGAIQPDFNFGETTGDLDKILELVQLIGAALASWKIGKALGLDLSQSIGLFMSLYSAMMFVQSILDIWNNGADWDNVGLAIVTLAGVAAGLGLAFGDTGAAIALVVGGLAMIVTGFKDVIENGANLQNTLLIIAGILAAGIGISILTGSWIPLMVAGIAALVYAIVAFGGEAEALVSGIKDIFSGLITFITGVLTGDWKKAWEGIKQVFKGVWNSILAIFGGVVNAIVKGLNWIIAKLNSLSWTVPDWVPGIGGETWGFNISPIPEWTVPHLAQGAVIPPNREFLAVLGDQKQGTNYEVPDAKLRQLLREELSAIGGGNEAVLMLDREVLGKVVYKLNKAESRRIGVNLAGV